MLNGTYNLSQLAASTTVSDLLVYGNDSTGGVLFMFFMIVIFMVMLLSLKKWDFDSALLSSSFSCFVISMIASYGGYVTIIFPLAFLAIAAFTALYMWAAKR